MRAAPSFLAVLAFSGLSAAASAADPPRGGEFFRSGPDVAASQFDSLIGDLATVLGPRRLGPSATTGALGFDISLDLGISTVDSGSAHWAAALPGSSGTLGAIALQARKGLPLGFEIGVDAAHLVDSDLWNIGFNLKYAILQGYELLPDVAIRGYLGGFVGARDFGALLSGGDLVVSKDLGLAGVVSLAPYAGYSLVYARASSNVSAYFDNDATAPTVGVIPTRDILAHRGAIGFRLSLPYSTVSFEALVAAGVQTYTMGLSLAL